MGQHTTVQSLYKRDILQGGYYAVLQPLQVQSEMHMVSYQGKLAALCSI